MPKTKLPPPVELFERFIEEARPLVVDNMVGAIGEARPRLEQVRPWLLDQDDLLTVAGVSFVEDAYTQLVAWALSPPSEPAIALACQRAWLSALGINKESPITKSVTPHAQFVVEGGRPDLVMDYRDHGFVLAVELKTGSDEHETPNGGMQTEDYPELVIEALSLPDDFNVEMAFLTPSGIPAANKKAINTTYHLFVVSLVSALAGQTLTPALKWSYSTIFTHLLRHASPQGLDGVAILSAVHALLGSPVKVDDDALLANLANLRSALMLLAPEKDVMSEHFTGFDKAAVLYAKHLPLIREMEEIFDRNMPLFEEALATAIKNHVPPKLFKFGKSKKRTGDPRPGPARFICLTEDDKIHSKHAFLRLDLRDVSPAASRQLTLVADALYASKELLRKLWEIPDQKELSAFCKLRGREKRRFFEVTVKLSDDGSLDSAGKSIAAVLKAMYTAETGRVAK